MTGATVSRAVAADDGRTLAVIEAVAVLVLVGEAVAVLVRVTVAVREAVAVTVFVAVRVVVRDVERVGTPGTVADWVDTAASATAV